LLVTYVGAEILNTESTKHDITAMHCNTTQLYGLPRSQYLALFHPFLYKAMTIPSFILPVILYGAKTWSPTWQLSRNINAFDQWCLCCIL